MNPERWERVKRLYDEAQAHPPTSRAAFLAQVCAGDEALHRDVPTLLDQPIGTDDLLAVAPAPAPAASLIGRRLGVYQLQALLGRGGMGDVYRARDTRLERDVAIKSFRQHPPLLANDSRVLSARPAWSQQSTTRTSQQSTASKKARGGAHGCLS